MTDDRPTDDDPSTAAWELERVADFLDIEPTSSRLRAAAARIRELEAERDDARGWADHLRTEARERLPNRYAQE